MARLDVSARLLALALLACSALCACGPADAPSDSALDGGRLDANDDALDAGDARAELDLGQQCATSATCASGECLALGDGRSVCTYACEEDGDCPASPGWECAALAGSDARVCACTSAIHPERCDDGIDDDCDGAVDECLRCGSALVPRDAASCARCGDACAMGAECVRGACLCPEDAALECDGRCVDRASDPEHCGGCGIECRGDQRCMDGLCECVPGSARPDFCPGHGCLDLQVSRAHCGACGHACGENERCIEGACECLTGLVCDGRCIPANDPTHCGACGASCGEGFVCTDGECVCAPGRELCSGRCVVLSSDPASCGACGNDCGSDALCYSGRCACASSAATHCAGVGCVDLLRDDAHCGTCGTACDAPERCVDGACGCAAPADAVCDDECVDLDADERSCGACGRACPEGTLCHLRDCTCGPRITMGAVQRIRNGARPQYGPRVATVGDRVGMVWRD